MVRRALPRRFWWLTLKKNDHVEDLGLDGRILK
jgi:hypothetical protein